MQKEPLKLLGGASAVGGVVGLLVGPMFVMAEALFAMMLRACAAVAT